MERIEASRIGHGMVFGMMAALVAGIVPVTALALGAWPTPEPLTATVFGRALGIDPGSAPALLIAGLWQIIYGAFWGGVLGYVTGPFDAPVLARPSTLAYGVGVGVLRWMVFGIGAMVPMRWGPFGLLVSPLIPVASLATELAFGVTAAWLLARDERGRLHVPRLRPLSSYRA